MKISACGQVTIPEKYRTQFGFLPNTPVEFVVQDGNLVLVRGLRSKAEVVRALRGRKKIGMNTDELMKLLRQ